MLSRRGKPPKVISDSGVYKLKVKGVELSFTGEYELIAPPNADTDDVEYAQMVLQRAIGIGAVVAEEKVAKVRINTTKWRNIRILASGRTFCCTCGTITKDCGHEEMIENDGIVEA